MADLLKIKKEKKSSNPKFIRQDVHKKKKLDKIWRKARGCDSKKRLAKNNRIRVKPGYGTPSELRGQSLEGKKIIMINKFEDISLVSEKECVVIVSSRIGLKNKAKIIEELNKRKIKLHNIKEPEKYLKNQQDKKTAKKKVPKKVVEEKKDKKVAKIEDKNSIEDKVSDEDKKKLEKKEIDKLLTKKF